MAMMSCRAQPKHGHKAEVSAARSLEATADVVVVPKDQETDGKRLVWSPYQERALQSQPS